MGTVPLVSGLHLRSLIESGGLRNGDRVTAHVLRALGGERYAVSLRGRVYPTTSTIPLKTGSTFTARVMVQAGGVYLRLDPPAVTTFDTLPRTDQAIAAQLLALGLPVDPSILARIRRFYDSSPSSGPLRARLAALLLDKGIEPSADLIADLESVVLGLSSDARRRRGRERHRKREEHQPDSSTPSIVGTTEEADHPVQLFNHLQGRHGQWILLPIATREGLDGSLQLFYPWKRDDYQRSVLTVRSEIGYWAFVWDNPQSTSSASVRLFTDTGTILEDIRPALSHLASSLASVGLGVDETISAEPISASFAIFQSEAIMRGVDRVV